MQPLVCARAKPRPPLTDGVKACGVQPAKRCALAPVERISVVTAHTATTNNEKPRRRRERVICYLPFVCGGRGARSEVGGASISCGVGPLGRLATPLTTVNACRTCRNCEILMQRAGGGSPVA